MARPIKLLGFLMALQMAFKQVSAQSDTLRLMVDSIPFEVGFGVKRGVVSMDTAAFNRMTWLLTNLNGTVADYQLLTSQYDHALMLSDSSQAVLRAMVANREAALDECDSINLQLDLLLRESLQTGDRILQDLRKEKTRSRWKLAGGITLGVGLGVCWGLLAR